MSRRRQDDDGAPIFGYAWADIQAMQQKRYVRPTVKVRAHDVDYSSGSPPTLCICGESLGECINCSAPVVCDDLRCEGCGAKMK